MAKALLMAVGLALLASPALSQSLSRSEEREPQPDRRERDQWRGRDQWHDDERGGGGRGARFMIRNGDAVVAVRHDHGSQYMSNAFQQELAFLGIESSPAFVRAPEGNGCAERFI